MPKRSRREDRQLAMIASHAPQQMKQKTKSSEIATATAGKHAPAPAPKPTGTGKGTPLDIPLKDFSPQVRKMLIEGMVKGGRARVVTRKQSKEKK